MAQVFTAEDQDFTIEYFDGSEQSVERIRETFSEHLEDGHVKVNEDGLYVFPGMHKGLPFTAPIGSFIAYASIDEELSCLSKLDFIYRIFPGDKAADFVSFFAALCIQRKAEIEKGLHAATARPLYVVYDVKYSYAPHDTEFSGGTSVFDDPTQYVRVSEDGESWIEAEGDTWMWDSEIVVGEGEEAVKYREVYARFTHDEFITDCLTRQAAEEFIAREKHNLKKPRIYVEAVGRRNVQMVKLLELIENLA